MSHTICELRGVSYTYRALPVLQELDWRWEAGQSWACLGPNGSGKTTLAKLLSRQLICTSGTLNHGSKTSGIAYVCFEQQKTLCDRDNQLDDSEFRGDAHDPGTVVASAILGKSAPSAEFNEWVKRLHVEHILNRGIRFISTGEMRKTLLLRAILSKPDLLILDSPLDGLDVPSQQEIAGVIEQLLAGKKLHILMLCRQSADIPEAVDHVLVLQDGRSIAAGPKNPVLNNANVKSILKPPAREMGTLPEPAVRPYQLDPARPLLKLVNVNVSYDDNVVLKNLSWTFLPGQHCCIAGPNGCGKTTLLSLINGDNHKAYGQNITLFGQLRGSGESVWDIKQKYGLVDTQLHLKHIRGMRVIEVVVSGFFDTIGLYDEWGDAQKQRASQWLQALGLGEYEKNPFDTLSFGMQRMALLARAMVKSPSILILDEPCLGLDGYHRATVLKAIDHIASNSDTQVLYVNHSAGTMPDCINQHLNFASDHEGFRVEIY